MWSYYLISVAVALAVTALVDARLLVPAGCRRLRLGVYLHALVLPAVMVACLRASRAYASVAVPVGRVAFLDEGVLILLASLTLLRDAVLLGLKILGGTAVTVARPGRRDVLRASVLWLTEGPGPLRWLAGGAASLAAIGHAEAVVIPTVTTVRVPIPALPPALEGLRIVQITDLHVGPTVRGGTVEGIVARVQALRPDAVAITGDLVDGFVEQLLPELSALRGLHSPLGTYFVPGNHEYFYRAPAWLGALRGLGITVLLNQHRTLSVQRHGQQALLVLAGVGDEAAPAFLTDHVPDLARALRDAPPSVVRVLLAHRPGAATEAAAAGVHLQLSGHLHGGQFFPMAALVRATERWVQGLHTVGGMQLYVSRGAGYWGPSLRLGVPPELGLLVLTRA